MCKNEKLFFVCGQYQPDVTSRSDLMAKAFVMKDVALFCYFLTIPDKTNAEFPEFPSKCQLYGWLPLFVVEFCLHVIETPFGSI